MGLVSLKTELRQELKLTPQLLQSMEVLQMNAQELLDYLNRVSEENPLLEQEDATKLRSAYAELRQKASWLDGGASPFLGEDALVEPGAVDRELESLSAFLRDQLERLHLKGPLLALTKYLAQMLDEDGYLSSEDLEELSDLKIPASLQTEALETLQSLDPPGVGARSLSECLLLQLKRRGADTPFLQALISRFLPELGRRHYGPIVRELGVTLGEIHDAERVIAQLEPHPGRAFQPEEPTLYIRPDVFILPLDGTMQVVLNEYYLPHFSISSYYTNLLKDAPEEETRTYLQEKLRQAKWLVNSLERRGSTLRRCADAILTAQYEFFTGKVPVLSPMNLASLAEELQLHPSTVSRATRGKYLQCRQGTYPLRYFFSHSVGGADCSAQAVRRRLLELVRAEDPHRPLSDQQLCRALEAEGMTLARRTVAKYRSALGLAPSGIRRR